MREGMAVSNRGSLEAIHSEHRLLAILRVLNMLPENKGNLPLMRDWLDAVGLAASMDTVRADLRSLKEKALIELHETELSWPIILTERGEDAAEGRLKIEGVCKAGPGCVY